MNYSEFKKASARADKAANDNTHYFSTHLAIPCAFLLFKLRMTPNQATFLFGVVGFCAGLSFWYEQFLLGWLLWRLHIVIDMADGSIARATKRFSDYADGFDKSIHIIVNTTVLIGLGMQSENLISINALLVAFYLYYLQNKIFSATRGGTVSFSIGKNIAKDLVSMEGFILMSCILSAVTEQLILNIIYAMFFVVLFVLKCRRMLEINADN